MQGFELFLNNFSIHFLQALILTAGLVFSTYTAPRHQSQSCCFDTGHAVTKGIVTKGIEMVLAAHLLWQLQVTVWLIDCAQVWVILVHGDRGRRSISQWDKGKCPSRCGELQWQLPVPERCCVEQPVIPTLGQRPQVESCSSLLCALHRPSSWLQTISQRGRRMQDHTGGSVWLLLFPLFTPIPNVGATVGLKIGDEMRTASQKRKVTFSESTGQFYSEPCLGMRKRLNFHPSRWTRLFASLFWFPDRPAYHTSNLLGQERKVEGELRQLKDTEIVINK